MKRPVHVWYNYVTKKHEVRGLPLCCRAAAQEFDSDVAGIRAAFALGYSSSEILVQKWVSLNISGETYLQAGAQSELEKDFVGIRILDEVPR